MKIFYLKQWLLMSLLLIISCRTETYSSDESATTQQQQKFQMIPKSDIPQIINSIQSGTDNFKIPLKNQSVMGKTETMFGEINTDFIVETQNEKEDFYIFPIVTEAQSANTYNLEVKINKIENTESSEIFEYIPTEEWLATGGNDFSTFSGVLNIYTLDGDLVKTISYLTGAGDCGPSEPCPDCPTNPQGPGNPHAPGGGGGTGGGGTPGGGWTGGGSGGGGSGGGGGGCGSFVFSHFSTYTNPMGVVIVTGEVWINGCGETMTLAYKTSNKADCSGSSGGVITALDINKIVSNINTSLAAYNLNLPTNATGFLKGHQGIAIALNNYIRNNNNLAGVQFVNWSISFFMDNPGTTWTQFANQFITLPPPETPIANIQDFLGVFNIHQSANLTVYAQKMFGGNGVGHAFISIKQGNNIRTFGFYPKQTFPANTNEPGVFGNNSGHAYTYGWNLGSISPLQLQQLIANSIAFSHSDYNVLMNNCSDFANFALQVAGVNINASGVDTPNTIIDIISIHAQHYNGTAP